MSEGPAGLAPHETEEQSGAGLRDAFQRLYTPHRMAYIKGQDKPAGDGATTTARSARSRSGPTTRR